jgi:tight adherence protein C
MDYHPDEDAMSDLAQGFSSSFKHQVMRNAKGPKFWDTFSETSSVGGQRPSPPPPGSGLPRGSSSGMSEDATGDGMVGLPTTGFAIAGLALGLLFPIGLPSVVAALFWGGVAAVLGFVAPSLWLEQLIGQRRRQIQRSLAEATDLLTLVVESGMSLDEGMLSITERFHNALGDEIGKVLREIRLGRPRMAALEHMADQAGVPDLHHLVESIVQSDQMGVPIARLLRVQATEMRRRQRQGAQERAAQASSRMVFPMVGCIFPVLWVVLLGPAIIQVLSSLK